MAADDLDLEAGSSFRKTITGATTLTVSNASAAGRVASFVLDLPNPGSHFNWWASSEERRVGTHGVSTRRYRWWAYHHKKIRKHTSRYNTNPQDLMRLYKCIC